MCIELPHCMKELATLGLSQMTRESSAFKMGRTLALDNGPDKSSRVKDSINRGGRDNPEDGDNGEPEDGDNGESQEDGGEPSENGESQEDGGDPTTNTTNYWWDIENAGVPNDLFISDRVHPRDMNNGDGAALVYSKFVDNLERNGFHGPLSITIVAGYIDDNNSVLEYLKNSDFFTICYAIDFKRIKQRTED
ncbi:unnamed protein product [Arabis nemorensis]|uniref:Uncharacterized protein n=1 Tax=Arabis nemorensis TaxID=586526 RepID=A0A565CVV9_9BRAS|nr:unnamed protein product [Arabis nemorensis]